MRGFLGLLFLVIWLPEAACEDVKALIAAMSTVQTRFETDTSHLFHTLPGTSCCWHPVAIPTLLTGVLYAAELPAEALPAHAVALALASFAALVGGWFWTGPQQYMLIHGLWHVLVAAAGYDLALAHAALAIT